MDAKITVEEMTAALNDVINYVPHRDPTIALTAARDYILAAESQLAERDAQIAEMRLITGPTCPKCGHWLKAEHGRSFIADYPNIAAKLGLTEASDGK